MHGTLSGVPEEQALKLARYAYVAAIWGDGCGFVLGALVLGQALRRSGTKHDLVLLHTGDVPASALGILSALWQLRAF